MFIPDTGRHLTRQEIKVLKLLCGPQRISEIANQLGCSARTAHFHTNNIYIKFSVHVRVNVVKKAREFGLIEGVPFPGTEREIRQMLNIALLTRLEREAIETIAHYGNVVETANALYRSVRAISSRLRLTYRKIGVEHFNAAYFRMQQYDLYANSYNKE